MLSMLIREYNKRMDSFLYTSDLLILQLYIMRNDFAAWVMMQAYVTFAFTCCQFHGLLGRDVVYVSRDGSTQNSQLSF
jgi:hypothetical protein